MEQENIITTIRKDVKVALVVAEAGLTLTSPIVKSLWHWFQDVEIAVPLPIMPINEQEQLSLTKDILKEMDEQFAMLEAKANESILQGFDFDGPGSPEGKKVDALWKELTGCYAALVNEEVPIIPRQMQEMVASVIVEEMTRKYDISEEEARHRLKTVSHLRMMLRMSGVNPDDV